MGATFKEILKETSRYSWRNGKNLKKTSKEFAIKILEKSLEEYQEQLVRDLKGILENSYKKPVVGRSYDVI